MPPQPCASSAWAKAMVCSMSQPPGRPVGAGDAHRHRASGGEGLAHGVEHLEREPHPVLEAAAVLVVALVRQRRQELVQQVAVRAVQLHGVEAETGGPPRRGGEGVADVREAPAIERRSADARCPRTAPATGRRSASRPADRVESAPVLPTAPSSTPCGPRARAGWRSACPTSAARSPACDRGRARCRRSTAPGRATRCGPPARPRWLRS